MQPGGEFEVGVVRRRAARLRQGGKGRQEQACGQQQGIAQLANWIWFGHDLAFGIRQGDGTDSWGGWLIQRADVQGQVAARFLAQLPSQDGLGVLALLDTMHPVLYSKAYI